MAPSGPNAGRLVVSTDQNSCSGVITGAPLAEVLINGAPQARFTLLLDAVRHYELAADNDNVSTRINNVTIGTSRALRVTLFAGTQPTPLNADGCGRTSPTIRVGTTLTTITTLGTAQPAVMAGPSLRVDSPASRAAAVWVSLAPWS